MGNKLLKLLRYIYIDLTWKWAKVILYGVGIFVGISIVLTGLCAPIVLAAGTWNAWYLLLAALTPSAVYLGLNIMTKALSMIDDV